MLELEGESCWNEGGRDLVEGDEEERGKREKFTISLRLVILLNRLHQLISLPIPTSSFHLPLPLLRI